MANVALFTNQRNLYGLLRDFFLFQREQRQSNSTTTCHFSGGQTHDKPLIHFISLSSHSSPNSRYYQSIIIVLRGNEGQNINPSYTVYEISLSQSNIRGGNRRERNLEL